jgi:hypothetical protein
MAARAKFPKNPALTYMAGRFFVFVLVNCSNQLPPGREFNCRSSETGRGSKMNIILYLAGLLGFLRLICAIGIEDRKKGFWTALFLFQVLAVVGTLMHLMVWRG